MKKDTSRVVAYILIGLFVVSNIAVFLITRSANAKKENDKSVAVQEISGDTFTTPEEKVAEVSDESVQTGENAKPEESIEAADDVMSRMLKRDTDDEYFTPITDDYMYVLEYQETGFRDESGDTEEATLYSFDETGRIVQMIKRRIDGYYTRPDFDLASYYPDSYAGNEKAYIWDHNDTIYIDMLAFTGDFYYDPNAEFDRDDPILLVTPKGDIFMNWEYYAYEDEYEGYYMSKPDVNLCTPPFENRFARTDFEILNHVEPKTDDYIISDNGYGSQLVTSYDEQGNPIAEASYRLLNDNVVKEWAVGYVEELKKAGINAWIEGDALIIEDAYDRDRDGEQSEMLIGKPKYSLRLVEKTLKEYWSKPYLTLENLNRFGELI